MEHLLNCHGELTALLSVLSSLPFAGMFLRTLRFKNSHKCSDSKTHPPAEVNP